MNKMKLKIQMFASSNKTANYELSQYVGSDKPTYLGDYNSDMQKIDAQMKINATNSEVAKTDADLALANAETAQETANNASEKANTADETANNALELASELQGMYVELNGKVDKLSAYSSAEVDTGKKWINGKPIYRKTLTGTFEAGGQRTINHNIADIELCFINSDHSIYYDGQDTNTAYVPVNGHQGGDYNKHWNAGLYVSKNVFRPYCGVYFFSHTTVNYVITLEYTKTTD